MICQVGLRFAPRALSHLPGIFFDRLYTAPYSPILKVVEGNRLHYTKPPAEGIASQLRYPYVGVNGATGRCPLILGVLLPITLPSILRATLRMTLTKVWLYHPLDVKGGVYSMYLAATLLP